ncbi:hypothetical protein DNTS_004831 [Danionella cerebrum]|uniref:Fibronectin type-III domain-containing protein n=1 Tax=Danionella cerebrum TaxID=2873325 RepID=A0A553RBT1_9TELE|nr:hypothetical protein DNTS_004831 [Danionella translucida]
MFVLERFAVSVLVRLSPIAEISGKMTQRELSPPKNLTVSLLDFTVTTEWLPGEGNPPGSRYSLEFSDLNQVSQGKWTKSPDYTDIDTLKCNWSFGQPDDHFRSYFVRVRSIYKEMKSNWTTLPKSFQPYEDSK